MYYSVVGPINSTPSDESHVHRAPRVGPKVVGGGNAANQREAHAEKLVGVGRPLILKRAHQASFKHRVRRRPDAPCPALRTKRHGVRRPAAPESCA